MNINKILVTGRLYKELQEAMEKTNDKSKEYRFKNEEDLCREDFLWADAYVGFRPTENFTFGNIKWVHSLGAGVDSFLYKRDWNKEVKLTRTNAKFGEQIAQYCLSYILREAQYHDKFSQDKDNKIWDPKTPKLLSDLKVLILGTGQIGSTLGKHLNYFGISPIGISLSGKTKEYFREVYKPEELKNLLKGIDWIINTLPLTEKTYELINFESLKNATNTNLINVGRAKVIDENGLIRALEEGYINKAILDVFPVEPIEKDSMLWEMDNVIITPHISAVTSISEGVECFIKTLDKIENDEFVENIVDIKKQY